MVGNSRRAPDTRRIRRLKSPQSVEVEVDSEGVPLRLCLGGSGKDLVPVRRPWRIDQQWWRGEPISRLYYRVAPEGEPPLTIFRNLINDEWFRQEY
jgi:hypothetical protein